MSSPVLRNTVKNYDINLSKLIHKHINCLPWKLNILDTDLTIVEFKKSDNDPINIKNKHLQAISKYLMFHR